MAINPMLDSLEPEEIQKLYMDLVETSQDLIWQCDAQGRFIYLNPAWEETLGYPLMEMIGRPFTDFQSPESASRDVQEFSRIIGGGSIKGYETIYLSKEGKEVHLVFNAKVVLNNNGERTGTRGTAHDITERKKTEAALGKSEEMLKRFFDSEVTGVGIIVTDTTGPISMANDFFLQLIGYTREEFNRGMVNWRTLTPPEWLYKDEKAIVELRERKAISPYEKEYVRRDGSRVPVFLTHATLPGPNENVITFILDLTKRLEAEVRLQNSENFFKETLRAADIGSYVLDIAKGTWESSDVLNQILGIDESFQRTVPGWLNLLHPENRETMEQYFQNDVLTQKKPFDKEYRIIRPSDGEIRWVYGKGKIESDDKGNPLSMLGTIQDITENKNREDILAERNQFIASLVNLLPDILYIYDLEDQRNIYSNRGIEDILGYSTEEIKDMGSDIIPQLMHPHDLQEYIKNILPQYITAKDSQRIVNQYRMRAKDGEWRYLESIEIIYKRKEDQSPKQIFGVAHDITRQKMTEEAQRKTDALYKSLFHNLDSSFSLYEVVYDDEGNPRDYRILAVNPMYEKTVGIKGEDIVGKTLLEVYPQTESSWIETMNSTVQTGIPFSIENYAVEVDKWIEITVYVPDKGQLAMIASDVTDRKKAELALADEEARLSVTLRSIGEGVITTDSTGKISMLNRAAELMSGWNSEEAVGRPLLEVFDIIEKSTGERGRDPVEEVKSTGASEIHESQSLLKTKDGETIIVANRGAPLRDNEGQDMGIVLVFRDMTEELEAIRQKEILTEQLHQSQKMEAIGQLAGGIAHDFNNSLGGILGAAELIQNGDLNEAEQKEYLEMLISAADRAGELTKKLLLFSRKGNKVSSSVDMKEIVSETIDLLGHVINKNISISMENSAEATTIVGDDSLLQNALMNMAINGSYAMPHGGELFFLIENLYLDEDFCTKSQFDIIPGDYLKVSIKDTGTGMSSDIQSHIFEPFFTTKEQGQGTGLGLATVYGTVVDHNGMITLESEQGIGTVFHLYFPVSSGVVKSTVSQELRTGSGRILVIDDEELIRNTAKYLLQSLGYEVVCATNGKEGLEIYKANPQDIDLIILDMIMPVMGGRETFAKLREIDADLPIIISSGFAKESELKELRAQGISGSLQKPFRRAQMAEMVAGVLGCNDSQSKG